MVGFKVFVFNHKFRHGGLDFVFVSRSKFYLAVVLHLKNMIRVLFTPLFCILILLFIPTFEQGMVLAPFIFGFTVSLVNIKKMKINPIIGLLVFIGISYAVYFLSIYLTWGIGIFYRTVEQTLGLKYSDLTTALSLLTGGFIASICMYSLYSLLLKDQNRKKGVLLILIIGLLLPFTVWLLSENDNYTDNADFANYNIGWLIINCLGFGIAINQSEINNWMKKLKI